MDSAFVRLFEVRGPPKVTRLSKRLKEDERWTTALSEIGADFGTPQENGRMRYRLSVHIRTLLGNIGNKDRVRELHCWYGNPEDISKLELRVKAIEDCLADKTSGPDTQEIVEILGDKAAYKEKYCVFMTTGFRYTRSFATLNSFRMGRLNYVQSQEKADGYR